MMAGRLDIDGGWTGGVGFDGARGCSSRLFVRIPSQPVVLHRLRKRFQSISNLRYETLQVGLPFPKGFNVQMFRRLGAAKIGFERVSFRGTSSFHISGVHLFVSKERTVESNSSADTGFPSIKRATRIPSSGE